jgi:hypothetical protein
LKTLSKETKPAAGNLGMTKFAFAENKLGGMVYNTSGLILFALTEGTGLNYHTLSNQCFAGIKMPRASMLT